jgi:acyl-CoA thioesterase YciA
MLRVATVCGTVAADIGKHGLNVQNKPYNRPASSRPVVFVQGGTMNLKYETSFTVYPGDCNDMTPMIFGGSFFSKLDVAAATCVRRCLKDSPTCDRAVTHKYEGTFHKPCYMGDLIFLNAEITSLGKKSVVVEVKAYRDREKMIGIELVAEAKFVFVSIQSDQIAAHTAPLPYANHGLTLESS